MNVQTRPRDLSVARKTMRTMRTRKTLDGLRTKTFYVAPEFRYHLIALREQYGLTGFEHVVRRMVARALNEFTLDEFAPVPPPFPSRATSKITLMMSAREAEFVDRVAERHRLSSFGSAVEVIASRVTDLTPAPIQLSLIEGEKP
jgi:hypothetical protein